MRKALSLKSGSALRMFRHPIPLILLLIFVMAGCSHTTHPDEAVMRINNILYNIKQAFNNHDIDALMTYFHSNYLHNGYSKWEIEQVWLDRMAEYLVLDFQNVQISVFRDEAVASFTMKLQNQTETVYYLEPAAHGDLNYFYYNDYDWYVYGNRHFYKKK